MKLEQTAPTSANTRAARRAEYAAIDQDEMDVAVIALADEVAAIRRFDVESYYVRWETYGYGADRVGASARRIEATLKAIGEIDLRGCVPVPACLETHVVATFEDVTHDAAGALLRDEDALAGLRRAADAARARRAPC